MSGHRMDLRANLFRHWLAIYPRFPERHWRVLDLFQPTRLKNRWTKETVHYVIEIDPRRVHPAGPKLNHGQQNALPRHI